MGYTTEFYGSFSFNKRVSSQLVNYINKFSNTRHMIRNPQLIKEEYPNWKDCVFNDDIGENGEYFVAHSKENPFGQNKDKSIIDYNRQPDSQPGLWCQWIIEPVFPKDEINKERKSFNAVLKWNGGEKFYNYINWLDYLITYFFAPCDYSLSGVVLAIGESKYDATYIVVSNNIIYTYNAMEENVDDIIERDFQKNSFILDDFHSVYEEPDDIYGKYWDYTD
jgi:hypothetical protein